MTFPDQVSSALLCKNATTEIFTLCPFSSSSRHMLYDYITPKPLGIFPIQEMNINNNNNNNCNWMLNKTFLLFLRLFGIECPKFLKKGSRHLSARITKSWPKPYVGAQVTYPNWDILKVKAWLLIIAWVKRCKPAYPVTLSSAQHPSWAKMREKERSVINKLNERESKSNY